MAQLDAMLQALGGADPARLRAALISLEAGEAAVDATVAARLIELLADHGKEACRRAAGALAGACARPDVRALVRAALGSADPDVRWGATFALSRAGIVDADVAEAAVEALGSGDGDVRWAAAEIVRAAAESDADVVTRLADAAGAASAEQRKMALYCLRDLGIGAPARFLASLDDAEPSVRLAALSGLGRLSDVARAIVERIGELAGADDNIGVRRAAAAILGRVGASAPDVAVAALERARDDGDADLARAASAALARLRAAR